MSEPFLFCKLDREAFIADQALYQRDEVARKYRTSEAMVANAVARLRGLGYEVEVMGRPKARKQLLEREEPPERVLPGKPFERAKNELYRAGRLRYCQKRGYILDGRPVTWRYVVEAANVQMEC